MSNENNIFKRVFNSKIRSTTILIIGLILGSLFLNLEQNRIIKIYENRYDYFEEVSKDAQIAADSLWFIINEIESKKILMDNVEINLIGEYNKLKHNPEEFYRNIINGNEEIFGGGEE